MKYIKQIIGPQGEITNITGQLAEMGFYSGIAVIPIRENKSGGIYRILHKVGESIIAVRLPPKYSILFY